MPSTLPEQADALLELTKALIAAPGPINRIAAGFESTESAEVSSTLPGSSDPLPSALEDAHLPACACLCRCCRAAMAALA